MSECDFGFFGDKFLQRRDGGGEVVFVDVALGFVEVVVERIVDGFFARLRGLRARGRRLGKLGRSSAAPVQ